MNILRGTAIKSIFIILPALLISSLFEWKGLPLSIGLGWLFGLFNLRSLSKNVKGLIGSERATAKIVFLNIARLSFLFIAITVLMYFRIINPFGLLFGFTVVFMLLLIEGLKAG